LNQTQRIAQEQGRISANLRTENKHDKKNTVARNEELPEDKMC